MFEVGKTYKIIMLEGGVETTYFRVIEKYEHPLLKLADTEPNKYFNGIVKGEIINVTSPSFVSAVVDE